MPVANYSGALKELFEMFFVLIDDVFLHQKEIEHSNNLCSKRAYVRSVFSLIEGITYRMKQVALLCSGTNLTGSDIALLKEEIYSLNSTGLPVVKILLVPTLPNLRFSFYIISKTYNSNYKLIVSGKGWVAIKKALLIRHRLTHPKNINDITVNDDDLDCVNRAFKWYIYNFILCLKEIVSTQIVILEDENVETTSNGTEIKSIKLQMEVLEKSCKPFVV